MYGRGNNPPRGPHQAGYYPYPQGYYQTPGGYYPSPGYCPPSPGYYPPGPGYYPCQPSQPASSWMMAPDMSQMQTGNAPAWKKEGELATPETGSKGLKSEVSKMTEAQMVMKECATKKKKTKDKFFCFGCNRGFVERRNWADHVCQPKGPETVKAELKSEDVYHAHAEEMTSLVLLQKTLTGSELDKLCDSEELQNALRQREMLLQQALQSTSQEDWTQFREKCKEIELLQDNPDRVRGKTADQRDKELKLMSEELKVELAKTEELLQHALKTMKPDDWAKFKIQCQKVEVWQKKAEGAKEADSDTQSDTKTVQPISEEVKDAIRQREALLQQALKSKMPIDWSRFREQAQIVELMERGAGLLTEDDVKKESIDEVNGVPVSTYFCDACDMSFKDKEQLTLHYGQHQTCGINGCKIEGLAFANGLHARMQHSTRFASLIKLLDSPEELKKWKEQRKKKYPTLRGYLRRQAEEAAKALAAADVSNDKGATSICSDKDKKSKEVQQKGDQSSERRRRSRSPRRRSRSPRRRSRSPNRRSRSPSHRSQRSRSPPARRSKSPKRKFSEPKSTSPNRRSCSPLRPGASSLRRSRSPVMKRSISPKRKFSELKSTSPNRRSRSPLRLGASSLRRSRSPARKRSTSPKRTFCERKSSSPNRRSSSPLRPSSRPLRHSRSPASRSRSKSSSPEVIGCNIKIPADSLTASRNPKQDISVETIASAIPNMKEILMTSCSIAADEISRMPDLSAIFGSQAEELTQTGPMRDIMESVVALKALKQASAGGNTQMEELRKKLFTEFVKEEFGDSFAEKLTRALGTSSTLPKPEHSAMYQDEAGPSKLKPKEEYPPQRDNLPAADNRPKQENVLHKLLNMLDSQDSLDAPQQVASNHGTVPHDNTRLLQQQLGFSPRPDNIPAEDSLSEQDNVLSKLLSMLGSKEKIETAPQSSSSRGMQPRNFPQATTDLNQQDLLYRLFNIDDNKQEPRDQQPQSYPETSLADVGLLRHDDRLGSHDDEFLNKLLKIVNPKQAIQIAQQFSSMSEEHPFGNVGLSQRRERIASRREASESSPKQDVLNQLLSAVGNSRQKTQLASSRESLARSSAGLLQHLGGLPADYNKGVSTAGCYSKQELLNQLFTQVDSKKQVQVTQQLAPCHDTMSSSSLLSHREGFIRHSDNSPAAGASSKARNLLNSLDSSQKAQVADQLSAIVSATGRSEVSEDLLAYLVLQASSSKAPTSDLLETRQPSQQSYSNMSDLKQWPSRRPSSPLPSTRRYSENKNVGKAERYEAPTGSTARESEDCFEDWLNTELGDSSAKVPVQQQSHKHVAMVAPSNCTRRDTFTARQDTSQISNYQKASSQYSDYQNASQYSGYQDASQHTGYQDAAQYSGYQDGSQYSHYPDASQYPVYHDDLTYPKRNEAKPK